MELPLQQPWKTRSANFPSLVLIRKTQLNGDDRKPKSTVACLNESFHVLFNAQDHGHASSTRLPGLDMYFGHVKTRITFAKDFNEPLAIQRDRYPGDVSPNWRHLTQGLRLIYRVWLIDHCLKPV